ncbi:MAG: hypothetical protein KY053_01340 [Candidatus Liptonbacteria bacterium]|nr:hypothetical protein [Candidatus Liptonbacteria bacterium]
MKKRIQGINFDEISVDEQRGELKVKEFPIKDFVFQIAFGIFFAVSLIAIFRVFSFWAVSGSFYQNRSFANVNRVIIQPAPRGIIFDRYNKPLVENVPSLNLYLKPSDLIKHKETEKVLSLLKEIGLSEESFYEILRKRDFHSFDIILLKEDISNIEAIKIQSSGLDSLTVGSDFRRLFHPAYSHIVGYVNLTTREEVMRQSLSSVDVVGRSGLELQYDSVLRGENGKRIIYQNAIGEKLGERVVRQPKKGNDIHTTIDLDLQKYFHTRFAEQLKLLERKKGAGIIINPKNGEILSLISFPSFSREEIPKLLRDPNQPFFNRAISGVYSPGSAIKPIIAVAALKEGIIGPEDNIFSPGYIEIPNRYQPDNPARFSEINPAGWVNVHSAIAKSSNVYFYIVGGGFGNRKGLGIDNIKKYFEIFNLDKKTGIEFPRESKGYIASLKDRKHWQVGHTYHTSIGQGDIGITPIGLLNAIASILNGGNLYKPNLILGKDPVLVRELSYPQGGTNLQPQLDEATQGMIDAVAKPYGTIRALSRLPIKIAGKTGTVEIGEEGKINALFVGCGPIPLNNENPSICVIVLVEDARHEISNTIPVVHDVFRWYYENRIK